MLVAATGTERTISFFNIHTKETITVTYKRDGRFLADAMKQVDWIMRDWRENKAITMSPQTIDLLWDMHRELGSKEPIHIICGYRSRGTNEMLRRTVGGQASQSQHISGNAIDVTFPDIPLKQIRYSALIREQGGVGYYPTSGIPFVHVDTARVRHWPRLPRYELALLFPNGRSQHTPADGRPISKDDVRVAQANHKEAAVQVANFFTLRASVKAPTLVADAQIRKLPPAPAPQLAATTVRPAEPKIAALPPLPAAATRIAAVPEPKLVTPPRAVERASRFTPPSAGDRNKLSALVTLAALPTEPQPLLVSGPEPAMRPATQRLEASTTGGDTTADGLAPITAPGSILEPQVAALEPAIAPPQSRGTLTDTGAGRFDDGTNWVPAPAFDEDHPEEVSYRPFPLAPLLTETASPDDPTLTKLVHPDVAQTLEFLDGEGAIQPMTFRPGQQVAELMWAQQFQGKPVNLDLKVAGEPPTKRGQAIANRQVKTQ